MSLEHGLILSWCCGTKRNSSVARLPRGLGQEQGRLGRDGSSNSFCIAFFLKDRRANNIPRETPKDIARKMGVGRVVGGPVVSRLSC